MLPVWDVAIFRSVPTSDVDEAIVSITKYLINHTQKTDDTHLNIFGLYYQKSVDISRLKSKTIIVFAMINSQHIIQLNKLTTSSKLMLGSEKC